MMRYLLLCLACLPAMSMAQKSPDTFDQEKFETRFRAADTDGDGRLSRQQAYAAFPRAPKVFDEIDADGDDHVTIAEVNRARARRIDAAASAGGIGTRYVKPEYLKSDSARAGGETDGKDMTSAIAQKRSIEFDEFLGGDEGSAAGKATPASAKSSSNLLKKSF